MIGKRQQALAVRALEWVARSPSNQQRVLEVAGATKVEALSKAGFEILMDQCTTLGFRDPRRPVLSAETLESLDGLFARTGMRPVHRATMLREAGHCNKLRNLEGLGLLRILVQLEKDGGEVDDFIKARRSVTLKQGALLHIARRSVNLDQQIYSDVLQIYGGANTAFDLDQRGFTLVIAYMRFMGFDDQAPASVVAPDFGDRPGFASAAQLGLIRELWAEWSSGADEVGLVTWLERSYRVSALRFLTAATASTAITALKAMKRRKAQPSKVTA